MIISRHGTRTVIHSPAKINLFLEILARRDDGYHELETLMSTISIFDSLFFQPLNTDSEVSFYAKWGAGFRARNNRARNNRVRTSRRFECLGDLPKSGEDNIVMRAINLIRTRYECSTGARVHLIKRIPSQAGLGGASSDAAAALVAANAGWGLNLTTRQLHELASDLGSDVPFFLRGGTAFCRGRGEKVVPVRMPRRLNVVVTKPASSLSTAAVFNNFRRDTSEPPKRFQVEQRRLKRFSSVDSIVFNRLQATSSQLCPDMDRLRTNHDRLHLSAHQMTGSGSGYFGVCRHARDARRVAEILRARRMGTVYHASIGPGARHKQLGESN